MALLGKHSYVNGTVPGLDPEGIFSTLPSIVSTLAGVIFGKIFLTGKKFSLMFLTGFFLILSGLFLDKLIPINKILWTPSYVLLMAGFAFVVFLLFSFLIDSKKKLLWTKPFISLGENALSIFFISTLIAKMTVYLKFIQEDGTAASLKMILYKNISAHLSSYNASLTYSLVYLSIWMIAAYVLNRKNIIIKI
jgi:predicted acyltransferase